MKPFKKAAITLLLSLTAHGFAGDLLPYQNPLLTPEERTHDLLSRLTLKEKIEMTGGVDNWFIRGNSRLGLPRVSMTDGPMGVNGYAGSGTVLPPALCLAASWDREMAKAFAGVEAHDCRAGGYQILLGPAVNLARNPLLGRNTEYFGEDPYLAGVMAVEIIDEVQRNGVMACIKHFVANELELPRTYCDSRVDELTLRELNLVPFEMGVTEAKVAMVMGCYNYVNGLPGCVHSQLVEDILRKEWGFDGIFLSDWGAGSGPAAQWANGPLDLAMPDGPMASLAVVQPLINQGKIDPKVYDIKLGHILRKCFEYGFYDRPAKDPNLKLADKHGDEVALQVAREGIVLLKNERGVLPFDPATIKKIAVLGPHSEPVRLGVPYVTGPSGSSSISVPHPVTILKGITDAAGAAVKVVHVPDETEMLYEQANYEHVTPEGKTEPGLLASYFKTDDFSGEPALKRVEQNLSCGHSWRYKNWLKELRPFKELSVRWEGQIRPGKTGEYRFVKKSNLGVKVWLGGEVIMDDWTAFDRDHWVVPTRGATRHLEAGKVYSLKIEYRNDQRVAYMAGFQFGWGPVGFAASVEAARQADAAVVCVGYDYMTEGEGFDRTFELPYGQKELIEAVSQANPRTVVVLTGGGACETESWIGRVSAMLQAWYLGQNGGAAVGEILFGATNPSGKLPVTFDARLSDNPSTPYFKADWSKPTPYPIQYTEGVLMGYRGYDHDGKTPLFPFGYGLSYTSFKYSALHTALKDDGTVAVSCAIENTGARKGAEVAQLYIGDDHSPEPRPVRQLKGFERVELAPGASKTVHFTLKRRDFAHYDVARKAWEVAPGKFQISVGASSRDLRLNTSISQQ